MSGRFQLPADLVVIEDLAVVSDPNVVVFVSHRLRAGGEINNAETAVSERHEALRVIPFAVRATVPDRLRHAAEHDLRLCIRGEGYPASNSAHGARAGNGSDGSAYL